MGGDVGDGHAMCDHCASLQSADVRFPTYSGRQLLARLWTMVWKEESELFGGQWHVLHLAEVPRSLSPLYNLNPFRNDTGLSARQGRIALTL